MRASGLISARMATRAALTLAVTCFINVPVSASPLSCWNVPTLDGLLGLGEEGCGLGHREFFDVTYSVIGSPGATVVAPSDVLVGAVSTRFSTGLSLTGHWSAPPAESVEVALSFRVRDVRVRGVDVWLDVELPSNSGSASMGGVVCVGRAFPCEGGALSSLTILAPAWSGSAEVHPGFDTASLRFSFALAGGVADASVIRSITTVFRVPEPSRPMLWMLGCAVYVLWRIPRGGRRDRRDAASGPSGPMTRPDRRHVAARMSARAAEAPSPCRN